MTILELYARGFPAHEVARMAHCSEKTVYRRLERAGIQRRRRGERALRCVECGKPTGGAERCPYHQRVRHAELNLKSYYRLKKRGKV